MLKKILMLLMMVVIYSTPAFAVTEEDDKSDLDPYIDGDLSIARCLAKGNLEFILFLKSVSVSDGFVEGVFEPFRDALSRNQCQSSDVINLIKKRDALRGYIRDAFLLCHNEALPNLKRGFYEANAEIYYARHIVDSSVVINLPYNWLSTQMLQDEESLYTPQNELKAEMMDRYVNSGHFTREEFDLFFNKLTVKYQNRKKSYVICENSSWKEVEEKWDEFIENAAGIAPAWEDLEKGVGGRAEKIVEATADFDFIEHLKGIVKLRINNLPPMEGFGELYDEAKDRLPEGYSPTQESMLNALQYSEINYNQNKKKEDLAAEFEILFKETNDAAVELFMEELNTLDQVLTETFTPLGNVQTCVQEVNDRQCASSR